MDGRNSRKAKPSSGLVPTGDLEWVCGLTRSTGSRPSARARRSQAPRGTTAKCRGSAQGPERPRGALPERETEKKDA